MKVLSYIISLILLWSTGAMAFAPGFLQVAGGGGAVVSTNFLYDTFSEGTDTSLSSHTPETGSSWTVQYGTSVNVYSGGYVGTRTTVSYNTVTPPSADYSVQVEGSALGATELFAAYGRVQSDGSGYAAYIYGDGSVAISKRGANGGYIVAALATGSISGFSTSSVYKIKLIMSGSDISAKVYDSSDVENVSLTASDSAITSAGNAGYWAIGASYRIYEIKAMP